MGTRSATAPSKPVPDTSRVCRNGPVVPVTLMLLRETFTAFASVIPRRLVPLILERESPSIGLIGKTPRCVHQRLAVHGNVDEDDMRRLRNAVHAAYGIDADDSGISQADSEEGAAFSLEIITGDVFEEPGTPGSAFDEDGVAGLLEMSNSRSGHCGFRLTFLIRWRRPAKSLAREQLRIRTSSASAAQSRTARARGRISAR